MSTTPTAVPFANWSFPALSALTGRFSMGEPRTFTVSPDGERVVFLRGPGPFDRALGLWIVDLSGETPVENSVVDPVALLAGGTEDVPEAERQRRERLREVGGGITSYSCDDEVTVAAFALSGRLHVVNLIGEPVVRQLGDDLTIVDPRMDPTGCRVAYVMGPSVVVAECESGRSEVLASASGDDRHVGLADFVAAEEFNRYRGHWWSPDGAALCYEVVDESAVERVWIFDPIEPAVPPQSRRYPKAGTANPVVSLRVAVLGSSTRDVTWDRERFPYLVTASWPGHPERKTGPLLTLMSRDQRRQTVVEVDVESGELMTLYESHDQDFLEWTDGLPTYSADGRLLVALADRESDTYRVAVVEDGEAVGFSPPGLQVDAVVGHGPAGLLVAAKSAATTMSAIEVGFEGTLSERGGQSAFTRPLAGSPKGTIVTVETSLEDPDVAFWIEGADDSRYQVRSFAIGPAQATPPVVVRPRLLDVGPHHLQVVVLMPTDETRGVQLPVIMSPYGGPHLQLVIADWPRRFLAQAQYLADQGFCVVVADGRGTGGRGPAWDRTVAGNLADAPVEDQVAALEAVVGEYGGIVDPSRVGIRGWSFGGYLAARCVLTRPDVFHAAVAGAPVSDFGWYDTGYTERYLGRPDERPDVYDHHSLLRLAPDLRRPLFLIHGYVDDNVLFCHTQLLSNALTAAGRPHRVVGLSGTTHMPVDPTIAEHMVRLEVEFFREALAIQRRTG